jgi:hypothetical protein
MYLVDKYPPQTGQDRVNGVASEGEPAETVSKVPTEALSEMRISEVILTS